MQLPVQASEKDEMKQLIMSLNSHVINLEKRVKELENLVKVKNVNVSHSKVTWRKLKRGMSYAQVRYILGEPLNISAGYTAYWYYSKSTYSMKLTFSGDKLFSWQEPEN